MFACLLFGDSLALGTATAVNSHLAKPCDVRAVIGAGSRTMTRWKSPSRHYDAAILSLGSNDDIGNSGASGKREQVAADIAKVRARLPTTRVIWLLPFSRTRAYIVRSVAATFGDEVLDLVAFPSRDGVHPIDYREIARALLR